MKQLCLMLASVLVLGFAVSALATSQFSNNIQDIINEKNANLSGNTSNPPEVLVGGETIGTAVPIGVPGSSSGNTCDNADDYDEACPYTGSTSGDEVYTVSGVTAEVTFDLCNSGYDTKLYVYENAAGNLIACNDDACNDPSGNPFRSTLCVNLTAGNTYYIVIDGYFGDCGEYNLSAYPSVGCCCTGCLLETCPPGALIEGEPLCGPGYVDTFNGGCNSVPPVVSSLPLAASVTVCGEGGNYSYNGLSYRDTDWYEVVLPVAGTVTASVCAKDFDVQLATIDGNVGCGLITILCGSIFGTPGSWISCTYAAPSGPNWIFVATSAFTGVPCGSPYYLTVECPVTNATENTSWGGIKGLYR